MSLRFNVEKYVFYSTQLVFRKEGALPQTIRTITLLIDYGESKIQSEQLIRANLPQGSMAYSSADLRLG